MNVGIVKRIHLLKVPVDIVDGEALRDVVEAMASEKKLHTVVLITLWDLLRARRSREYRNYLEQASLVLPVSRGIVRGASFLKKGKLVRFLPYDFVIRILGLLEERQRSVYLLGGRRDVLMVSERKLRQTFPGLRIVGRSAGYYRHQVESDIILAIKKATPSLLLAGNGVPGKEKWLRKNAGKFSSGIHLWCGDCYEIFAERKKRISRKAFQRGLEYFPEFVKRPWRLARSLVYLYYMFLLIIYRLRKL